MIRVKFNGKGGTPRWDRQVSWCQNLFKKLTLKWSEKEYLSLKIILIFTYDPHFAKIKAWRWSASNRLLDN